MNTFGSYLVCHSHTAEVKAFLLEFLEEVVGPYTHSEWLTFRVPGSSGFVLNLMSGDNQELTQNFTIEIYCASLTELQELAQRYSKVLATIAGNKAQTPYTYYYFVLDGPAGICKIELSFTENLSQCSSRQGVLIE